MKTNDRADVYQIVTDRIIALLESGVVPWQKPWSAARAPKNLASGKNYRGVNVWMLGCAGFTSPYFVSYKQAQDLGGQVRKGEKSQIAVFWKMLDKKGEDGAQPGEVSSKDRQVPMLRYYHVFNVTQCDGLEYPAPEIRLPDFNPIAEAERLANAFPLPPQLTSNEQRAFYSRSEDRVNMPDKRTFETEEAYYGTLFHELTHATGHESRIGRLQDSKSGFRSTSYAKEELIAEMGASFMSALAGIEGRTIDNSAAYINSWLGRLKDDRKLVVTAAAAAQKAVDYMTGNSVSV